MYVIDITRDDGVSIENDMLVGKLSSDSKTKTLNYIREYALANINIDLDMEKLDSNVNMDFFSLKNYLSNNYSLQTNKDLIIQSHVVDKDNCIFVKQYNKDVDPMPILYQFNKEQVNQAKGYMAFLVNDELINFLGEDDKLEELDKYKQNVQSFDDISFKIGNKNYELCSLYNGELFMEELLNNAISYKQLQNDIKDIEI